MINLAQELSILRAYIPFLRSDTLPTIAESFPSLEGIALQRNQGVYTLGNKWASIPFVTFSLRTWEPERRRFCLFTIPRFVSEGFPHNYHLPPYLNLSLPEDVTVVSALEVYPDMPEKVWATDYVCVNSLRRAVLGDEISAYREVYRCDNMPIGSIWHEPEFYDPHSPEPQHPPQPQQKIKIKDYETRIVERVFAHIGRQEKFFDVIQQIRRDGQSSVTTATLLGLPIVALLRQKDPIAKAVKEGILNIHDARLADRASADEENSRLQMPPGVSREDEQHMALIFQNMAEKAKREDIIKNAQLNGLVKLEMIPVQEHEFVDFVGGEYGL